MTEKQFKSRNIFTIFDYISKRYICMLKYILININQTYMYTEASRSAGAQYVTVKSTGGGFDPTRVMNNYLYFHFFAQV